MPRPPVFADTSFFIALENKDDPCHERAKKLDRKLLKQKVPYLLHRGIQPHRAGLLEDQKRAPAAGTADHRRLGNGLRRLSRLDHADRRRQLLPPRRVPASWKLKML